MRLSVEEEVVELRESEEVVRLRGGCLRVTTSLSIRPSSLTLFCLETNGAANIIVNAYRDLVLEFRYEVS